MVGRRLVFYVRTPKGDVTAVEAAAQQQAIVIRTVLLSAGYVARVVSILEPDAVAEDAIAAMLAYVSALNSAYCMATLPVAALAAVLLAPTTAALYLLGSDAPLLIGFGANPVLGAVLALRPLNRHHLSFVESVRSRLLLAEEGARSGCRERGNPSARTDALTGVLNRRGFLEQLAERSSTPTPPHGSLWPFST